VLVSAVAATVMVALPTPVSDRLREAICRVFDMTCASSPVGPTGPVTGENGDPRHWVPDDGGGGGDGENDGENRHEAGCTRNGDGIPMFLECYDRNGNPITDRDDPRYDIRYGREAYCEIAPGRMICFDAEGRRVDPPDSDRQTRHERESECGLAEEIIWGGIDIVIPASPPWPCEGCPSAREAACYPQDDYSDVV
jgi:hypothetical protein